MCLKWSEKQWEHREKLGVQLYIIRKQDKQKLSMKKVNANGVGLRGTYQCDEVRKYLH